jgi:hypothetical protein
VIPRCPFPIPDEPRELAAFELDTLAHLVRSVSLAKRRRTRRTLDSARAKVLRFATRIFERPIRGSYRLRQVRS